MGKKGHFTQKQKLDILESAKEIGIKEAGNLAGIHYTMVYQWQRKLEVLGDEAFLAYRSAERSTELTPKPHAEACQNPVAVESRRSPKNRRRKSLIPGSVILDLDQARCEIN